MKKKLEAELISIAHRILKLKNKAEIEQLQQETLKLYEKLSVLRFVEENFSDVKPTIGHASAEEKLEEIYGLEEKPVEEAKQPEADSKTDDIKEEKSAEEPVKAEEAETDEVQQDKENDKSEGADVAEGEAVSEEEIEYTEEETDEEVQPEEAEEEQPVAEQEEVTGEPKHEEVSEEEKKEEQPLQEETKKDEPKEQKESLFAGFEDYIEPEFVKKTDIAEPNNINIEFLPKDPEIIAKQEEQAEQMWEEPKAEEPKKEKPKQEEVKEEPAEEEKQEESVLDWRDWEPSKSKYASKPEEPKKEETKKTLNDTFGKVITLGLNDRIAFEKNLFGGSGDDLNRVVSQLNTMNSYSEAKDFIEDLVKPDYNNWKGKEEYEERFMALVEKRFE